MGCCGLIVGGVIVLAVCLVVAPFLPDSDPHSKDTSQSQEETPSTFRAESYSPNAGSPTAERILEPPPSPNTQRLYRVKGVARRDLLNARAGAGEDFPILFRLPANQRNITLLDGVVTNGDTVWQQVQVSGQSGWVNSAFLEPVED